MGIEELDKPRGAWCTHCVPGTGCGIYVDRPPSCRAFHCAYLGWRMFGEHWFPARSKMVPVLEADGNRLVIYVDPARPTAWRAQPFYNDLKLWSRQAARDLRQVVVVVGDRSTVILPDEDVDLGITSGDERIVLGEIFENGRPKLRAMKLRADDPRLTGAQVGKLYGSSTNRID